MKPINIEFNVTKKIGKSEYGIPTDYDSFMELLDEATRTENKMEWSIDADGIRFYLDKEEIGCLYIWEEENETM